MARPLVADGGDILQLWKVKTNTLNEQLRRAHKGWAFNFGVGRALPTPHRKNYAKCHKGSLTQKTLVNKVMTFRGP
jgi:hypothetical protein